MKLPYRRQAVALAFGLLLCTIGSPVLAQAVAAPVTTKIILPLPAGGGVDVFVRKLAETMGKIMGTTVIVDNKPGASGLIAVQAVASGPGDGSNILYLHSGILTAQAMTSRIDVLRDFKPIGKVSSSPHVLVVAAASPYLTQADLIAAIKTAPGKLNYGSGGKGSPTHLMFEQLDDKVVGGLVAAHIPFKGAIEAVVGILGGNIDFTFAPLGSVHEHLKTGKLRALSTTGDVRMPQLPSVPTVAEAGVTGYVDEPWGGLAVPAGTTEAQVNRVASVLKAAMADSELQNMVARVGGKMEGSASPSVFAAQIREELVVNKALVAKLGLKMQ